MMETMIPPQVGMRLRTLWKIKEAKEAQIKKREANEAHQKERKNEKKKKKKKKWEKKREGAMLLSFYHTCASK